LAPYYTFSLYGSLILLPFLFLPVRYFKTWLLKIASWFMPLAYVLVVSESPHDGGVLAIGREGVVVLAALVLANLTVVFLIYTYAQTHDRYKQIAGFWYFLLLGLTLFASTYLAPHLL